MTVKREYVDRRAVDSSDVATERLLPPVHPAEILRDEFLRSLDLGIFRLARALKISRPQLVDIVPGRRDVTTNTAVRLACSFGTTPEFWIKIQPRYDLDAAERTLCLEAEREIEPFAANADPVTAGHAGAA